MPLLPTQNSPPTSCYHNLGRERLLIPPGSIYLKTAERGGETYNFLY